MREYLYFLLGTAYLLHIVEEYCFGFSEWVSQHFGQTTNSFFIISHIPLTLIVGYICLLASRNEKFNTLGIFLSTLLFVNGLFHLITTYIFQEYSPGAITGIFFYFPVFYKLIKFHVNNDDISKPKLVSAGTLGLFFSLLIIASLYLDVA